MMNLLTGILLNSCYYDSEEVLYPVLSNECDTMNVTFSGTVVSLLQDNCWSCHSNSTAANLGNGIFLEDYSDIFENREAIQGAIKHEAPFSPMPKNAPKLDECHIKRFDLWIEAGAPSN